MSDNKKRRFGLADLRFAVDWQAVLICVSLIVFNFVWRYRSIAPFDIKNFVFESVIGTLLILAFSPAFGIITSKAMSYFLYLNL